MRVLFFRGFIHRGLISEEQNSPGFPYELKIKTCNFFNALLIYYHSHKQQHVFLVLLAIHLMEFLNFNSTLFLTVNRGAHNLTVRICSTTKQFHPVKLFSTSNRLHQKNNLLSVETIQYFSQTHHKSRKNIPKTCIFKETKRGLSYHQEYAIILGTML